MQDDPKGREVPTAPRAPECFRETRGEATERRHGHPCSVGRPRGDRGVLGHAATRDAPQGSVTAEGRASRAAHGPPKPRGGNPKRRGNQRGNDPAPALRRRRGIWGSDTLFLMPLRKGLGAGRSCVGTSDSAGGVHHGPFKQTGNPARAPGGRLEVASPQQGGLRDPGNVSPQPPAGRRGRKRPASASRGDLSGGINSESMDRVSSSFCRRRSRRARGAAREQREVGPGGPQISQEGAGLKGSPTANVAARRERTDDPETERGCRQLGELPAHRGAAAAQGWGTGPPACERANPGPPCHSTPNAGLSCIKDARVSPARSAQEHTAQGPNARDRTSNPQGAAPRAWQEGRVAKPTDDTCRRGGGQRGPWALALGQHMEAAAVGNSTRLCPSVPGPRDEV